MAAQSYNMLETRSRELRQQESAVDGRGVAVRLAERKSALAERKLLVLAARELVLAGAGLGVPRAGAWRAHT